MVIESSFLSTLFLVILEISKAALVVASFMYLSDARDAAIVRALRRGHTVPRYVRSSVYWDHDALNWKYEDYYHADPEIYGRKALITGVVCFAAYVIVQFGLSRADTLSLVKVGISTVLLILLGGLACLNGNGTPFWHKTVIVVLTIACIAGYIAAMCFVGWSPVGLDMSYTRVESEVVSEETLEITADRPGLSIELGSNRRFSFGFAGTDWPRDESHGADLELIEDAAVRDGEMAPYVVRRETVKRTYVDVCRLPITWTLQVDHLVVYEYHYGDRSTDFLIILPKSSKIQ